MDLLFLMMPTIFAALLALVFALSMALIPQPPILRWSLGAFTPMMAFIVYALADPQPGCEHECLGRAMWFSVTAGVAVGWIIGYVIGSIVTRGASDD